MKRLIRGDELKPGDRIFFPTLSDAPLRVIHTEIIIGTPDIIISVVTPQNEIKRIQQFAHLLVEVEKREEDPHIEKEPEAPKQSALQRFVAWLRGTH